MSNFLKKKFTNCYTMLNVKFLEKKGLQIDTHNAKCQISWNKRFRNCYVHNAKCQISWRKKRFTNCYTMLNVKFLEKKFSNCYTTLKWQTKPCRLGLWSNIGHRIHQVCRPLSTGDKVCMQVRAGHHSTTTWRWFRLSCPDN